MPRTIIMCDIDGVLADNRHRLPYIKGENKDYDKFYSYDSVLKDSLIAKGDNFLYTLANNDDVDADLELYFVTGRSEDCRIATEYWLDMCGWMRFNHKPTHIRMRPSGDYRKSSELKVEIIGDIVTSYSHNNNTFIFIDDDPENVKAVEEAYPYISCLTFGTDRMKNDDNK